jgi:WhiB family transcriptional regulator, redox-sensing transcriptional regulator
MTRREMILDHLRDHPEETSGEIGLGIGVKGGTLRALLADMRNKGELVSGVRWAPYMGREVSTWSIAPPGTKPIAVVVPDRERQRRRERDRAAKRRSRAKSGQAAKRQTKAGPLLLPGSAPIPDLRGAACKGADTNLFFSSVPADIEAALAMCTVCPVRMRCAQWADSNGEQYGVWAGEDREARRLAVAS